MRSSTETSSYNPDLVEKKLYKKVSEVSTNGRQDKVVTGRASEEMAEKLGCQIHMYDSLGHAAYEEAKGFNQIVYDFLNG